VRLGELRLVRGRLGLPVECDRFFSATKPISAYAEKANKLGRIAAVWLASWPQENRVRPANVTTSAGRATHPDAVCIHPVEVQPAGNPSTAMTAVNRRPKYRHEPSAAPYRWLCLPPEPSQLHPGCCRETYRKP